MRFSILLLLFFSVSSPGVAQEFNETWYDGKAELNGYQITVSRYGENRTGTAVLIYVTEPFDDQERVKADQVSEDTYNVMKLNLVRDFQTGIYDYNTMVSVFCHDRSLELQKVSFSSAEWCGHVYENLRVDPQGIDRTVHSYFQGESQEHRLPWKEGGILEDHLFILLRSLHGTFIEPGEAITRPFLPGPYFSRLTHREPVWSTITIRRTPKSQTLTVPAGSFEAHRYDLETSTDRTGSFWVEDAYPHRILRWSLAPDRMAELSGSTRLPYWELHGQGHETHLKALGF